MKIGSTSTVNIEQIKNLHFDLFIVSSGYENRASYLSRMLEIKSKAKMCLMFDRMEDIFARKINDEYFIENGFTMIKSNIDSYFEIGDYLKTFITTCNSDVINILVDYSSMSRVWYSYVLSYFDKINHDSCINIYFSYCKAQFVPPPEITAYKNYIAPIEGYYSILPPTKPTALIISLGYIKRQAFGLSEYFEAEPFVFIGKNSEKDEYYNSVLENNDLLLSKVPKENIFYYSLTNLTYTEALLNRLCKDLSSNYRIVIAPCGPKPFTLISLITCLKLTDIDVWRISASSNNKPVDKIPTGEIVILKVTFE